MAWVYPVAHVIDGNTRVKDADNKIQSAMSDLTEYINSTGAYTGIGLSSDFDTLLSTYSDTVDALVISHTATFDAAIVGYDATFTAWLPTKDAEITAAMGSFADSLVVTEW